MSHLGDVKGEEFHDSRSTGSLDSRSSDDGGQISFDEEDEEDDEHMLLPRDRQTSQRGKLALSTWFLLGVIAVIALVWERSARDSTKRIKSLSAHVRDLKGDVVVLKANLTETIRYQTLSDERTKQLISTNAILEEHVRDLEGNLSTMAARNANLGKVKADLQMVKADLQLKEADLRHSKYLVKTLTPRWLSDWNWLNVSHVGEGNMHFTTVGRGYPVRLNGEETAVVLIDSWGSRTGSRSKFGDLMALMMQQLRPYGVRFILGCSDTMENYKAERRNQPAVGTPFRVPPELDFKQQFQFLGDYVLENAQVERDPERRKKFMLPEHDLTDKDHRVLDALNVPEARKPEELEFTKCDMGSRNNTDCTYAPEPSSCPNSCRSGLIREVDENGRCWCHVGFPHYRCDRAIDAAADHTQDLYSAVVHDAVRFIRDNGVKNLIYVGKDSLHCVIGRSVGMLTLRRFAKRNYVIDDLVRNENGVDRNFQNGLYIGSDVKAISMNWDL